jgi:GNAT superfamily N-acetyltransferase
MRIDFAAPDDYEAICSVLAEGDAQHEAHLPDVFRAKRGPARPRDFLLQRIAGPESTILVARDGPALVGVLELVMRSSPDRDGCVPRRLALIDNVVVRASSRRRGIGSLLLARAEAWALEHGASATELNVWSFNESAMRLYERLGYVTRTVRMERHLEGVAKPED